MTGEGRGRVLGGKAELWIVDIDVQDEGWGGEVGFG